MESGQPRDRTDYVFIQHGPGEVALASRLWLVSLELHPATTTGESASNTPEPPVLRDQKLCLPRYMLCEEERKVVGDKQTKIKVYVDDFIAIFIKVLEIS